MALRISIASKYVPVEGEAGLGDLRQGARLIVCQIGRIGVSQVSVVFEILHPFLQEAASSVKPAR